MARRQITQDEFDKLMKRWKLACVRAQEALIEFNSRLSAFWTLGAGYISEEAFHKVLGDLDAEGLEVFLDESPLNLDSVALYEAVVKGIIVEEEETLGQYLAGGVL